MTVFHKKFEPHYIYRCYDHDDRLVYIGCSNSVKRRIVTHLASRRSTASILLQRFMARHEVDADTYPGSIRGREAEGDAIWAEKPLFNQQHVGTKALRSERVAEYVYEQTSLWLPKRIDSDGYPWGYRTDAAALLLLFAEEAAA